MNLEYKVVEETLRMKENTGGEVHIVMNTSVFQEFLDNYKAVKSNSTLEEINEDGLYGKLTGVPLYVSDDIDGWEVREGRDLKLTRMDNDNEKRN